MVKRSDPFQSTVELRCVNHPACVLSADYGRDGACQRLVCAAGCCFPVVNGVPRFVSSEAYASSFGLQWNVFRSTQLDSFTGTTISRDRLTRIMGGSLDFLHGKTVLEAGCGAGRFTEVLLSAGAKVFALDLSSAVEAAYQNVGNNPNVFVCQADILDLPLGPEQFDIVVCIGVVQHTPDPEETIRALSTHVKPGGILILDHYTYGYPVMASRRFLRQVFLRLPSAASFQACRAVVALLWPIHVILWKHRQHPLAGSVRDRFLRYSPVVDYHGAYEQLGPNLLRAWAMLDTHDTLTDAYKHMRSADEIEDYLARCGLTDIRTAYAGNGVEARARKPVRQEKPELNRKVKSA